MKRLGYEVDFNYQFANYRTMKLCYLKGKDFKINKGELIK